MENFNKLTPAETERLALLSEELGEAQQVIGKILRHGYESYNPQQSDKARSNRKQLEFEIGHIVCAVRLMTTEHDVREDAIDSHSDDKRISVTRWTHHQLDSRYLSN